MNALFLHYSRGHEKREQIKLKIFKEPIIIRE